MTIKRICILGGGTSGWMTAAGLSNKLNGLNVEIRLVESDSIGTVGVGEATLPHIRFFNKTLGIDEREFMRETRATFKLGIEFCDWGQIGDSYIHPFGDYGEPINGIDFHHFWLRLLQNGHKFRLDDYSYPILAAESGRFQLPGSDNEGKAINATQNAETGLVETIELEDGTIIGADLFIDCSGFRGVLIEQLLETGYDDWSQWLPCNRAVAVQCESAGPSLPYTRATARDAGWQWRIPLQHRTGNGYVYWNKYISDDEATHQLMSTLEGPAITDPKQLYFKTGKRRKLWNKNVVAIGLSGGFLEPLESTSIHLIQEGITALIELFPDSHFHQSDADEYNRRMDLNFDRVRDLSRGYILRYEHGVFLPPSWVAVMAGQNLMPEKYDLRVDQMKLSNLKEKTDAIKKDSFTAVEKTPEHGAFLESYMRAPQATL